MTTTFADIDWDAVVRCEPRVRSIANGLTNDPEEAKEIVQETILRLASALRRYRHGNFDGWLYRVTRNVFLDRCRHRARRREVPLPPVQTNEITESDPVLDAGDRLDTIQVLSKAILALPPTLRVPVVLRDVEGLSYAEIAKVLSVPTGTVRSRIHRGRERLRVDLAPFIQARRRTTAWDPSA